MSKSYVFIKYGTGSKVMIREAEIGAVVDQVIITRGGQVIYKVAWWSEDVKMEYDAYECELDELENVPIRLLQGGDK